MPDPGMLAGILFRPASVVFEIKCSHSGAVLAPSCRLALPLSITHTPACAPGCSQRGTIKDAPLQEHIGSVQGRGAGRDCLGLC